MRGWRLRLRRAPDPVIGEDAVEWLEAHLTNYIGNVDRQTAQGLVSESVIRGSMYAAEVRAGLRLLLESYDHDRYWLR